MWISIGCYQGHSILLHSSLNITSTTHIFFIYFFCFLIFISFFSSSFFLLLCPSSSPASCSSFPSILLSDFSPSLPSLVASLVKFNVAIRLYAHLKWESFKVCHSKYSYNVLRNFRMGKNYGRPF